MPVFGVLDESSTLGIFVQQFFSFFLLFLFYFQKTSENLVFIFYIYRNYFIQFFIIQVQVAILTRFSEYFVVPLRIQSGGKI